MLSTNINNHSKYQRTKCSNQKYQIAIRLKIDVLSTEDLPQR